MFHGDFNGPLIAKDWTSRFSSQVNPEALQKSQLDIVVATLYAHPFLTLSLRDSIRRQIALAQRFVQENPAWIIARTPEQAKQALDTEKHVLIFALEGASGILETEEDLKEFIDQAGIRIVTLLHLTDDEFGGVAFLNGIRGFASPLAFVKSLFSHGNSQGIRVNSSGLTALGLEMTHHLIRRHVWIDLAHASDGSQKTLAPILRQAGQPLLYTHTVLRRFLRAERGISDEQLREVAETKGFMGLMPSEEMLVQTPPLTGTCEGSVHSLANQYREAAKVIGESSVSMGSDFNGGIPHLKPSCATGTSLDQKQGYWNIGQTPELWQALQNILELNPENGKKSTDRFIDAWSRVFKSPSESESDPQKP